MAVTSGDLPPNKDELEELLFGDQDNKHERSLSPARNQSKTSLAPLQSTTTWGIQSRSSLLVQGATSDATFSTPSVSQSKSAVTSPSHFYWPVFGETVSFSSCLFKLLNWEWIRNSARALNRAQAAVLHNDSCPIWDNPLWVVWQNPETNDNAWNPPPFVVLVVMRPSSIGTR